MKCPQCKSIMVCIFTGWHGAASKWDCPVCHVTVCLMYEPILKKCQA